jgi:hypothetical protein
MADLKAGAGKIQHKPEASCNARKLGNTQKPKMTEACQKDTGTGLVKPGTSEQHK